MDKKTSDVDGVLQCMLSNKAAGGRLSPLLPKNSYHGSYATLELLFEVAFGSCFLKLLFGSWFFQTKVDGNQLATTYVCCSS